VYFNAEFDNFGCQFVYIAADECVGGEGRLCSGYFLIISVNFRLEFIRIDAVQLATQLVSESVFEFPVFICGPLRLVASARPAAMASEHDDSGMNSYLWGANDVSFNSSG